MRADTEPRTKIRDDIIQDSISSPPPNVENAHIKATTASPILEVVADDGAPATHIAATGSPTSLPPRLPPGLLEENEKAIQMLQARYLELTQKICGGVWDTLPSGRRVPIVVMECGPSAWAMEQEALTQKATGSSGNGATIVNGWSVKSRGRKVRCHQEHISSEANRRALSKEDRVWKPPPSQPPPPPGPPPPPAHQPCPPPPHVRNTDHTPSAQERQQYRHSFGSSRKDSEGNKRGRRRGP